MRMFVLCKRVVSRGYSTTMLKLVRKWERKSKEESAMKEKWEKKEGFRQRAEIKTKMDCIQLLARLVVKAKKAVHRYFTQRYFIVLKFSQSQRFCNCCGLDASIKSLDCPLLPTTNTDINTNTQWVLHGGILLYQKQHFLIFTLPFHHTLLILSTNTDNADVNQIKLTEA